jgi:hypothetical protein
MLGLENPEDQQLLETCKARIESCFFLADRLEKAYLLSSGTTVSLPTPEELETLRTFALLVQVGTDALKERM